MRVVIQRVSSAGVTIDGLQKAAIGTGLMVLAGFEEADEASDLEWMANKIVQLRLFDDEHQVPNISVKDILGNILLVSQFTLHASTKKGNRPSYIKAAKPYTAIPLYQKFIELLQEALGKSIFTGTFGANMKVSLVNDGPVTITIDSKNKD
ncbi:MAG: D-tyrosyl-tRNA(Tyr) deacylase [Chitinophagaceae bacterium]|nr:MAG: D-tyrosyl-tRNA(Tyr) deacylase [Chitinophagaceae bacterium]